MCIAGTISRVDGLAGSSGLPSGAKEAKRVEKMRMRRHHWLASVMLMMAVASLAEAQGVWRVSVRDTAGFAVPFAVLDASPGGRRVADAEGVATFPRPSADSVLVHVRRIGFAQRSVWLRTIADGQVRLEPLARVLTTMNITERQNTQLAQRGFYDRMERVQKGAIVGEFITPEDLDRLSPMTLSRALVESRYVKIAGRPGLAVFLGRSDCGYTVLVDGVRVASIQDDLPGLTSINPAGTSQRRAGGGRLPSMEELVAGSDIAAIEVYPSAANAPSELQARAMGGRGSCGIIAIWTGGRR